jgi:hypothetical protein
MNAQIAIHSLLEKSSLIKRTREQQLRTSGERFNIFSILRLEYNEAKLHSQFIADFLSPSGTHGQHTLFLQKFLEKVNLPQLDTTFIDQTKVYTEEYIGPIPTDYSEGGLIDVVIKIPHNQIIVIENKINAGDQKHQLIRYKRAYPNSYLLYLTKEGCKPSKDSTHFAGKEIVDFEDARHCRISYKVHILEWLEECYKEITRHPLLRETLFQYIATIKTITNQSSDNYMSDQIADAVVSTNAHLEGFFTLREQKMVKAVERKLLYKFIDEMEVVAKELGLSYEKSESNRESFGHEKEGSELIFRLHGSPISIEVGFTEWRMGFCIGLGADNNIEDKEGKELKQKLSKHFSELLGKDSDFTNYYYLLHFKNSKHGDEYLHDWHEGSYTIWGAVNNGDVAKKMKGYLETFIKELKELGI